MRQSKPRHERRQSMPNLAPAGLEKTPARDNSTTVCLRLTIAERCRLDEMCRWGNVIPCSPQDLIRAWIESFPLESKS